MPNENLNPQQFPLRRIKDLLKMKSADAMAMGESPQYRTGPKGTPGTLVKHTLQGKLADINDYPEKYDAIREDMATRGQRRPIAVDRYENNKGGQSEWLAGGHHRIVLAQQLGWKYMHVGYDLPEGATDDKDFDRNIDRRDTPINVRHQGRWQEDE